ncbi:MAG: ArsR/SmtB family transcription factor [Promethearchaeota archaeon]
MVVENQSNEEQTISLDTLLEVLGNPTRRMILAKLAKVPHSAPELARSLGITRQAVHSQLNLLSEYNLIENMDPPDTRGGKYRIKSNISVRIDITPDYYNISYQTSDASKELDTKELSKLGCFEKYSEITDPDEKIKFLGEQLKNIERKLNWLENDRMEMLHQKECLILEIKKIMNEQYKDRLKKILRTKLQSEKDLRELLNLTEEIFFTLFFNPQKYHKKISIDNLLDDLFFADMNIFRRDQNRTSIQHLLKDMSSFMKFLWEEEDDWFFDI